jgi:hypothetical protein
VRGAPASAANEAPFTLADGAPAPRPVPPPPRPQGEIQARPEDIVFEVDRPGGTFRRLEDGAGNEVFVMTGNPRITGAEHVRSDGQIVPALDMRANKMVIWVDSEKFAPLKILEDVRSTLQDGGDGDDALARTAAIQTILQEAVLGIYAEGAVKLQYGDLTFRAEQLHIEPRTFQALLIEPRFEGRAQGQGEGGGDVPLHVRAQRARLVAKGVAVFDEADVGISRSTDRIGLQVRTLTVEELEEGTDEGSSQDPSLLGFRNLSSQTYHARGTRLYGERVPLFYWPSIDFGYPGGESFPVGFKRAIYGNRNTLGRYLILGFGGLIGPADDPWLDWTALVGGYTKKGPAAGARFAWKRPWGFGMVEGWGIYDFDGEDFDGYVPPEAFRWRLNMESRTALDTLAKGLSFDAEFNQFSDRNVNLEYWENEQLTHKDYESYGRLRYQRDTFVGTLIGKWHERQFVTETTELPQLALWFTSVPLLAPRVRGRPSVDLTSVSRAGRLERVFDDDDDEPSYGATRLQTDTRLNLAFDAGDVRVSSFGGVYASSYLDRTDGEDDLTRAALLGGARANLQIHKAWPRVRGGFFQLQRLRHVMDVDVGFAGSWFNDTDLDVTPYFDLTDSVEQRTETFLRLRNRVQTRDGHGGVRNVLDLEVSWLNYVDDIGPYGLDAPGEIDYQLRGQPRERLYVGGEGRWDLEAGEFYRASIAGGGQPHERVAFFTGLRYVRGGATAPFVDIAWRWSEKYGFRLLEQYDFKNDENRTRFVLGRYSADHAWFFGFSYRGRDDVGLEFNFQPTIGTGGSRGRMMFNDQPTLDPWNIFDE